MAYNAYSWPVIFVFFGGCGDVRPPAGTGADDATATESETNASPDPTTTGVTPEATTQPDDEDDGGTAGAPKYDLLAIPDAPELPCTMGGGTPLSYIWIANTQEGTISKINTQSMEEEGRYRAKPSNGDPSRTSVNLNGNVAVANRNGGIAKFWSNPAECVNSNGQPGIQTSTGAGDVLAFGDDDCMAWYTDLNCSSNRPAAWTRGTLSEATCRYEDPKLWTVCDSDVLLIDGDTGEIEETIPTGSTSSFVYGGAADADGNFWGIDFGGGFGEGEGGGYGGLLFVDGETFDVQHFSLPNSSAYGITVDSKGRPWVCSQTVARFNVEDESWSVATDNTGGGGCMSDGGDRIWHGGGWEVGSSLYGFNIDSLELEVTLSVPQYTHGISIDAQDNIWGVTMGNQAYRVDPESGTVDTFNGLIGAYTYSDMTGLGLAGAGGGGSPSG